MKNFKEKRKSLKKKILKKSNTQETQVAKITNTTLEEQRKEILNKGKKFKYPVQYSKNRLVGNALIIALVILITGSGLLWYQLYQAQNTGEFIYRFTTVIPFPVANVDGENALYRDYLMEYRANMQIANAKKDEIESANNVKALSVLNKNKAMKNAIANAYAQKKPEKWEFLYQRKRLTKLLMLRERLKIPSLLKVHYIKLPPITTVSHQANIVECLLNFHFFAEKLPQKSIKMLLRLEMKL